MPVSRPPASSRGGYARLRFEALEARRVLSANPLLPINDFGISAQYASQSIQADASSQSSLTSGNIRVLEQEPTGTLSAGFDQGTLWIVDTAGIANQLTFRRSGNDLVIHDAAARFVSLPAGGTLSDNDQTLTIPLAAVPALDVALADGDDQFALDFADGNPVPASGLNVRGGEGSNTLQVLSGNFATITSTLLSPTSGRFNLDGAVITHQSISPTLDVGSASDLVFQLPSSYASGAILQDDGIAGNSFTQLRGDFPQPYFPTVTFPNPTGSLSIQRGHAASTLDLASLPDFDAALELGSAEAPLRNITFAGEVAFEADRSLAAYATGQILLDVSFTDIPVSETGSHIAVSGTGSVSLTAARNIVISHGASITSVDGDITLSANQQSQPTSGQFAGISLANATISATGTGNIQLNGRGGTTAGGNVGVYLEIGASVSTNTGAVTVVGTGGASTGNSNVGVFIRDGFTGISGGGPVLVNGTGGGSGASSSNHGVYMFEGARIAGSGPSAQVTVLGSGGNSTGSGGTNRGVFLAGAEVVSGGGDVLVVGTGGGGGASGLNQGVLVQSGRITTEETDAALTVRGLGGNPSGNGGNDNSGVAVSGSPSIISSGTGAMLIEGTGGGSGNSSSHHGVAVTAGGRIFTEGGAAATVRGVAGTSPQSTASRGILVTGGDSNISTNGADVELIGTGGSGTSGTGILITSGGYIAGQAAADGRTISLTADSIDLQSAFAIEAYNHHVQLRPLVAGTLINLGSSDVLGNHPRTLGLTDLELDRIHTERLTIGSAESGTLSISNPITRSNATDLTLVSGGEIVFDSGSVQTAGNMHLAAGAGVRPITSGVDVTASQVTFAPDSTLRINIDGTVPGSQYQQLRVAGGIDLSNVTLALTGNATSLSGETFKIVDNSGYGGISGQFTGLPEGGVINDFLGSGLAATITYVGGDGNDVVLSVEHAAESDIYVTTFADVLDANDGFTSLREAIRHANLSPGNVTIHLAAGTYTLTRGIGDDTALAGDLDIASGGTVTIVGVAADQTVIDAAGLINPTTGFGDRAFHVLEGADLTLAGLTVTGGKLQGHGGGILNSGQLTLADTVITGNQANSGGGIRNSGMLSISASSVSGNVATGSGGGIHSVSILAQSELVLTDSTISNNTAINGGGLWTDTETTIVDSTFTGNLASMDGGAIAQYLQTGIFTLTGSTLYLNSASRHGGGLFSTGTAVVANSTVSGNEAGHSGGGIANSSGNLTVQMSTLFGNRADSAGQTTGIGGGLRNNAAGTTLHSTLVVGNLRGPASVADDIGGSLHGSSSFNLISDAATAGGLIHGTGGNRIGRAGTGTLRAAGILDPVLADNGGPTATHALVAGSLAIDAGNQYVTHPAPFETDQRGYTRAADGNGDGTARVDIGAYELQQPFSLSEIVVTTFADTVDPDDGELSLREAVMLANATAGHQTILLPAGSFTLSIAGRSENAAATGDLDITGDVTIQGAGREATIIDAGGIDRVFDIGLGVTAELNGLTMTGGAADRGADGHVLEGDGGGLRIDFFSTVTIRDSNVRGNSASSSGGAVRNSGQLTILNSVLENNAAVNTGGAIYIGAGEGTTILSSTLRGNTAREGGAIFNHRPLLIRNSTLSGNSTTLSGGAINNNGGGELTLIHSTVSGNSVAGHQTGGGIINFATASVFGSTIAHNTAGTGGGFTQASGEVRFENTIIANNTATVTAGAPYSPNVSGTIISGGYNLISDTSGSSGFGAAGDRLQVDPLLGPLADNGGATQTHALLAGSPAIDAGNPDFNPNGFNPPLIEDQRGLARMRDSDGDWVPRLDIGAYELQTPYQIIVTTVDDVLDPSDGLTSLREAIIAANGSDGDVTIVLNEGNYNLSLRGGGENVSQAGDLDILSGGSVTIIGAGAGATVINAANLGDRVFHVLAGASLRLEDLAVTGGRVSGDGGGILNFGVLRLERVNVRDNTASFGGGLRSNSTTTIVDSSFSGNRANGGGGGAILQANGMLTLSGSTLSDNHANYGGGLRNFGAASVTHSTFTGNTSVFDGGGIADSGTMNLQDVTITGNTGRFGGGVWNAGDRLVLTHGTLINNSADFGGGIWSRSSMAISDSTLMSNTAAFDGGAIVQSADGPLTLKGSTLANNTATFGGGLLNTGSAAVLNSTFSGNQARNSGGGISSDGTLVVTHSTFYGNRADADVDGTGIGGGVSRGGGTITLQNTIVAGNLHGTGNTADDVAGPLTAASSFNLIGDSATAGRLIHGVSGNLVGNGGTGTLDASLILNPVLADNGGPTLTHALVVGSRAIDAGDPSFNPSASNPPLVADQRGLTRVIDGLGFGAARLDIGAYELQQPFPLSEIVVTTFTDTLNPSDGLISLREAVILANQQSSAVTINLAAGTYQLTLQGAEENAALTGDLDILAAARVTIVGAGAEQTTIAANGLNDRIFHVLFDAELNLDGLTLTGGVAPFAGQERSGGAIFNAGTLGVANSTIVGNSSGVHGGGIGNFTSGVAVITSSIISGNSAGAGGAITNGGQMTLTDTLLSENTASEGGAIYTSAAGSELLISGSTILGNSATFGSGISAFRGQVDIRTSTITENEISDPTNGAGGGIFVNTSAAVFLTASTVSANIAPVGGGIVSTGQLRIANSTIAGNSASASLGGGIISVGTLTMLNSTVSGNSARQGGGGIVGDVGTMHVAHSTLFGNRADSAGVGAGTGGGILILSGGLQLQHSIVAGNVRGTGDGLTDDIAGTDNIASSYNLIGTGGSGGLVDGVTGNLVGIDPTIVVDPELKDNGGPTLSHALLPGSPAINAGNINFDPNALDPPLLSDQRGDGFARVWGGRIDLGAYELQRSSPPILTLPPAPVEASEGQWMLLSALPLSVSDPDPASGVLSVVFEVSAGGEFQRLEGPSQGMITLVSPARVEFTGTLDQLNQSDLSLVRFRATGATTDGTLVMNVHVADSGEPTSGISGQLMLQAVNEPPVLLPIEDRTAALGQEVVILGSFSDLGLLDQPWTLEVDWDGSGFVAVGTLSEQGEFTIAHTFAVAGSHNVQVRVVDKDGGVSNIESFAVEVAAPAAAIEVVGAPIIGRHGVSRSRVDQMTVQFNQLIDHSLAADAFAIILKGTSSLIGVQATFQDVGDRTNATLRFSGTHTQFGSLVDGNYQLTIDSSKIAGSLGAAMSSNYVFGNHQSDGFFRLFGDLNGDRRVTSSDLNQMLFCFTSNTFDERLAFNDDSVITSADLNQILARFSRYGTVAFAYVD